MSKILIVANTYERARSYATKYGYQNADIIGGNLNQLRGRHTDRIVVVGELDERTEQILAPFKSAGAEVLRGD